MLLDGPGRSLGASRTSKSGSAGTKTGEPKTAVLESTPRNLDDGVRPGNLRYGGGPSPGSGQAAPDLAHVDRRKAPIKHPKHPCSAAHPCVDSNWGSIYANFAYLHKQKCALCIPAFSNVTSPSLAA